MAVIVLCITLLKIFSILVVLQLVLLICTITILMGRYVGWKKSIAQRNIFFIKFQGLNCCSTQAVSFHYISSYKALELEYFLYHLKIAKKAGRWSYVQLANNIKRQFMQRSIQCSAYFLFQLLASEKLLHTHANVTKTKFTCPPQFQVWAPDGFARSFQLPFNG